MGGRPARGRRRAARSGGRGARRGGRRAGPGRRTFTPELGEALYRLLYRARPGNLELGRQLQQLERKHKSRVYSELLYLLSHLRFEADEAKRCWQEIVAHRDAMQSRLAKDVDVRVALVSYFLEVNRRLHNPKIIELKVFEQTQKSAYRDELTGLSNYRYFQEYLEREVRRGERFSPPLSLVMVDIDNFKTFNDRHGHQAGNRALAAIARLLAGSLRKIDIAARYGGEEFALILPSTSKTGAQLVAERARVEVEKRTFLRSGSRTAKRLTVSMGVATYPADAREAEDLVRCADSALYVAKTRGRNQVHLYGENRRSYRRISAALDGTYCVLSAEYRPMTTLNVSEGGVLFVVDRELAVGSLLDVTLKLPGAGEEIAGSGRVVRVEERAPGRFEAAIRILDISTRHQAMLTRYVREAEPGVPMRAGVTRRRVARRG